ncbi:PPAC phosphatase, partial [Acromyrmex charruanus]
MAEAVFQDQIRKMDLIDFWEVESAAILDYHVGNDPEPRATATLQKAGITDYSHIARKITIDDFYKFDWIFGMDKYIIDVLYEKQPEDSQAKIELLGKYDPSGIIIIKDPLFNKAYKLVNETKKDVGNAGFERAFQQALRSVRAFLEIHKVFLISSF